MENKITIFDKKDLTNEEQTFIDCHNKIVQAGTFASVYLYEMVSTLKKINDDKLYLVAGYSSLEDYTEDKLNIKKSQAYKYIKIAETFKEEFFHSSGKNIGVTKLSLLTNLGDGAIDFVENNPVEDMSVSELKKEIETLKSNLEDKDKSIALLNDEIIDRDSTINSLSLSNEDLQKKIDNTSVVEKVKEIKVEDTSKIEELNKLVESQKTELDSIKQKLKDAKSSEDKKLIKELKDNAVVLENKIKELNKKLVLSSNENFNLFKAKFNLLQSNIDDIKKFILNIDDQDFKVKCNKALKALFEGVMKND